MSIINVERIETTDTFKEWADKCNAIIDGLSEITIPDVNDIVFINDVQTITGAKTFTNPTVFQNGFSLTNGDFNLGGNFGTISPLSLIIRSGSLEGGNGVNFVGPRGINFEFSDSSFPISLRYGPSADKLIFNYGQEIVSGTRGTFELADGNILSLAGNNPRIRVGNTLWNLSGNNPGANSLLKWNDANNKVEWAPYSDIASEIGPAILDSFGTDNLTLTTSLIPVGATIDIDASAVSAWAGNGGLADDSGAVDFPNWLLCNGQTITSADNSAYAELIRLLTNDPNATSAVLPDHYSDDGGTSEPQKTTKLIKYAPDPLTVFQLNRGAGISFVNSSNVTQSNIGLSGGIIKLDVDQSDFKFTNDSLQINAFSDDATPNSNVKRNAGGQIIAATPTENNHLTTKEYVDAKVDSGSSITLENNGSTLAFPEIVRGSGYFDGNQTFVMVDKFGIGKAHGKQTKLRGGHSTDEGNLSVSDLSMYAISPITNQFAKFKRAFGTPVNYFFVDEDDIIYGTGSNASGIVTGTLRMAIGRNVTYYWDLFPFTSQRVTQYPIEPAIATNVPYLIPAFLSYPGMPGAGLEQIAGAVTLDYVVNSESLPRVVSNDRNLNVTIKTKDGVLNTYNENTNNDNDRFSGLKKAINSIDNKPYTRGWFLSTGDNYEGKFGTGITTSDGSGRYISDQFGGPQMWGGFSFYALGRSLYAYFALQDSGRRGAAAPENLGPVDGVYVAAGRLHRRFNYYKPNAAKAGGLDAADAAALAAWQTDVDLPNNTPFEKYSWFIKKMVQHNETTFVIVGKPGTELSNELWTAGSSKGGVGGTGSTSARNADFMPVLSQNATVLGLNGIRVAGEEDFLTRVFKRVNTAGNDIPHGFDDFERLYSGNTAYIIVRGDAGNNSLETRFRLFPTTDEKGAAASVLALLSNNRYRELAVGFFSTFSATALAKINFSHRAKFKGIYDISVSSFGTDNAIIAKRAASESFDETALDALPEERVSTNTLWGWGIADAGQNGIGQGRNTNNLYPIQAAFDGGTPASKITKIFMGDYIGAAYALTANGDLYACGYEEYGMLDSAYLDKIYQTSWKKCSISSKYAVKDFFIADASTLNRAKVFLICEDTRGHVYLYAGGYNLRGQLGSPIYINRYTPRFIRIPFPENPSNIVNVCTVDEETLILCKNDDRPGRVYAAGYTNEVELFSTAGPKKTLHPYFRNVDRFIA